MNFKNLNRHLVVWIVNDVFIDFFSYFLFVFFSSSFSSEFTYESSGPCVYVFTIKNIYKYVGDDFHKGQVNDVPSQKQTTTTICPADVLCVCIQYTCRTFRLHVFVLLGKSYESVIFFSCCFGRHWTLTLAL